MEKIYLVCKERFDKTRKRYPQVIDLGSADYLEKGLTVSCKGAENCPIKGCSSRALVESIENGTVNYPSWKRAIFGHGTMRPIFPKKQKA